MEVTKQKNVFDRSLIKATGNILWFRILFETSAWPVQSNLQAENFLVTKISLT